MDDPAAPKLLQVLPCGLRPEVGVAVPARGLYAVASEKDDRGDAYRSTITIYERQEAPAEYPTITSADRADGTPIGFSALSGLACGHSAGMLYSVEDSYFHK